MNKIKDTEKAYQEALTYIDTDSLDLETAIQIINDSKVGVVDAVNRAYTIGFMNGVKSLKTVPADEIDSDEAHTYSIEKVFDEWSLQDTKTGFGHYLGYEKSVYIQIGDLLIPADGKEIKLILQ